MIATLITGGRRDVGAGKAGEIYGKAGEIYGERGSENLHLERKYLFSGDVSSSFVQL